MCRKNGCVGGGGVKFWPRTTFRYGICADMQCHPKGVRHASRNDSQKLCFQHRSHRAQRHALSCPGTSARLVGPIDGPLRGTSFWRFGAALKRPPLLSPCACRAAVVSLRRGLVGRSRCARASSCQRVTARHEQQRGGEGAGVAEEAAGGAAQAAAQPDLRRLPKSPCVAAPFFGCVRGA